MSESHGNGDASGFSIIGERTIPETYSDSVNFEVGVFGVTLLFGIVQRTSAAYKGVPPSVPRVRVHMSPQHAKVMAKLFVRTMQQYEAAYGPINLPKGLLEQMDLPEEW